MSQQDKAKVMRHLQTIINHLEIDIASRTELEEAIKLAMDYKLQSICDILKRDLYDFTRNDEMISNYDAGYDDGIKRAIKILKEQENDRQ